MVLRLDPRVPRVWRTPSSLQFGVSRPVVVLADVTVAQEQMIAALVAGVTRRGLGMIGRTAGALDTEIDAFLELISPALSSVPSRMSGLMSGPESALTSMRRVVVAGSGRTAEATASLLDSAGYSVQLAAQPATAERLECDLAVAVGQFVVHPDLHGLWLRRDIPHLSVVLADTRVTVGPVVHPGYTACLYCQLRQATDADTAWPAIASQLWGRSSPIDDGLVAGESAALAARLVSDWFSGTVEPGRQLQLDAATGVCTSATIPVHPACGCLEAGASNARTASERAAALRSAGPPEIGSGSAARPRGPAPVPTTD